MNKMLTVTACVALALTGCTSHPEAVNVATKTSSTSMQSSAEDNEVALLEHKQSLLNNQIHVEQQNIDALGQTLSTLQNDSGELEQRRDEVEAVLSSMNTADDALSAQEEYRAVWQQLKQNQMDTLATHQRIAESQARLAQLDRESATLEQDLTELKEARTFAHATRLQSELTKEVVLEIRNQELCSMTQTFNNCVELSKAHSLEKAKDLFQSQLLNATQYSSSHQLSDIQLNANVDNSVLLDKHFDGDNELTTVMQVTLHSSPNADSVCQALNVDGHYCQS
ncbi:hypothetical protein L1D19_19570 [Vibrio natriegens]|uniref:hypothetical protein n=1 Tax=Vibrio natriegens TaxID=691 RepID=UPI001EFCCDA1|nr:hypothetical protein [Vibrio natriegens]MCG9702277.1 hypothetical protein [Vibrio natriegens]